MGKPVFAVYIYREELIDLMRSIGISWSGVEQIAPGEAISSVTAEDVMEMARKCLLFMDGEHVEEYKYIYGTKDMEQITEHLADEILDCSRVVLE